MTRTLPASGSTKPGKYSGRLPMLLGPTRLVAVEDRSVAPMDVGVSGLQPRWP